MSGEGRLTGEGAAGAGTWTARQWELLKTLEMVADELNATMAQVAIDWVATRPGIASAIVGAGSAQQLDATMRALDFTLLADLRDALDRGSEVLPAGPCRMFTLDCQSWLVDSGAKAGDKPEGNRPAVRNWVAATQA
ncbi:aldo/keto reductase [Amycolatopsis sp. AA4]|nr:aldo/keto reductase [Amycolatopsis sp. AA4]